MTEATETTELTPEQIEAQEQADFEAGFKGESIEPEQEDHDDTIESAEGADTVEGEQAATPEVYTKEDMDRLRAEIALEEQQKHLKRIRDLSGEVGGLKDKLNKLETAKAAATDSNNQGPTNQEIRDAAKGGKALEKLREDFGDDLADALMEYAEELKSSVKTPEHKAPEPTPPEHQAASPEMNETAMEVRVLREQRRLDRAHPDWEQTAQSPECQSWIRQQSPELQAAFNRTFLEEADADAAITILTKFKNDMTASQRSAAEKDRRNQRQAAAVTPTQGGAPPTQRRKTEYEEFLEGYKSARGS